MTEQQRLFLVQARADFAVFNMFQRNAAKEKWPACHALHYFQMATELLGKALSWRQGQASLSHRALVGFLRSIINNRKAQKALGVERNEQWAYLIKKSIPLAEDIENLAPSLAGDNPNPEYPWPKDDPVAAPAEFEFPIWRTLQESPSGRQFKNSGAASVRRGRRIHVTSQTAADSPLPLRRPPPG